MKKIVEKLINHINNRIDMLNKETDIELDYQFTLGLICALNDITNKKYWLEIRNDRFELIEIK